MPEFTGQVTFLYTRDLARSRDFYEHKLGLSLWLDQGACRIYHVSGGGYLGLCQQREDAPPIQTEGMIFTFVTDEVDAWYETLRARGVDFEKAPAENPKFKIYHCFLRDPDGYLLEIQRFLNAPDLV